MRALLAAMCCPVGDPAAGLARHRDTLALAQRHGCGIAVFPEMSLTGSVRPALNPDRALALDVPVVAALAAATAGTAPAALFGLAERGAAGFHITQIFASEGRVQGFYRKCHLGEGEEGFLGGARGRTFALGGIPFGVAICAESTVDYPFDEAAAAGCSLVFFCAAPGLWHRRVDEAGWRRGLRWWEGSGLADVRRHARRLGIWVALATQAGSTPDEDFPGLAALVDPRGDVVARLPDWRAGHLVVDIPLDGDT
jgi:predicted amidohydrolase